MAESESGPGSIPSSRQAEVVSDLYSPSFVQSLFDEMASTYGFVNFVSSLGFAQRWRKQALNQVPLPPGARVADLMSGMGELWPTIASRVGHGSILAVDISPEMSRRARDRPRASGCELDLRVADVLTVAFEPNSVDVVVSTFGLKTFSSDQLTRIAAVIGSILRPGGRFSLLEISVPPNLVLRTLFMFYVCRVIPIIGRFFLGNPDNYRLLGLYTGRFGSAQVAIDALRQAGLRTEYRSYFFGCATGVVGEKPDGA